MAKQQENIHNIRHSLAHLLAATVVEMYPGAQNAIGPAIENGFYQDFDMPKPVSDEDLPKIEAKMREMLKTWSTFARREVDIKEAHEQFSWNRYKREMAEELAENGEQLTFYTSGKFIDLCRGGHVEDAGKINPDAFKLTRVSGAYWRGDEKNKMLQRIYGVAFATKTELDNYLKQQEEAKKYDHRKLGKELDLFAFSELVGAGLPLYTPRGALIRNKLKDMLFTTRRKYGGIEVATPHIAKIDLYKKSGHAEKFEEELFIVKGHYGDFALKPVSCPHHIQIYNSKPRSYRDLPLPYIEFATQYRDEKPGQIGGLSRVRGFTVDDNHTFLTVDQIKTEVGNICHVIREFYTSLGMYGEHWVSLSLRDPATPEKYIGSKEGWAKAEQMLREISDDQKLNAKPMEGEAALYGPKLDFMFKDATGRDIQLSTIQLDFATPERFGLVYTDENGEEKPPVMIHSAVAGSFERFMVVLIEKLKGHFPFWLAPEQVRVLTINDEVTKYVDEVKAVLSDVVLNTPLKYNELRFEIDDRNESLGKKIREAETSKVPVMLILGPKDEAAREISVRAKGKEPKVKLTELAAYLSKLN